MCLHVHQTDSVRKLAYSRDSQVGSIDKGIDQAKNDRWKIADMANA